jgi:protein-serine/threonine kinase
MDEIYQRSTRGVSNPTNFAHKIHVGFDPDSGMFTVRVVPIRCDCFLGTA